MEINSNLFSRYFQFPTETKRCVLVGFFVKTVDPAKSM